MDFLDPAKMKRHNLMVFVGYGLIGIAIAIAALVLLYQSYGYGINKQGEVIQNGLVFAGSIPSGAAININSEASNFKTNKRLILPGGKYVLQYTKTGYRPWTRSVVVDGSSVNRLDYAFLFPKTLTSVAVKAYDIAPPFSTQSPDRRWTLVQSPSDLRSFDVYDLKNFDQAPVAINVPQTVLTAGENQSWQLVEWSNDNRHVLLKHMFGTSFEYILVDRSDPTESRNLNTFFGATPTEIRLVDKKYDRYYIFSQADKTLQAADLGSPTPRNYLKNVLAYKSYGDDTMLYVTDDTKDTTATSADTLAVKLAIGDQTYTIRRVVPGTQYLLEIAKYDGDLYVAAGSNAENKVVVYKNPVSQISNPDIKVAVQVATLKVANPTYVSFSANTQFIMIESGSSFAVYDAETEKNYSYSFANEPLDMPQLHAIWMDGDRILYVSGGKLFVFDYDQTNRQTLGATAPAYLPNFTPDYKQLFTLAPQTADKSKLQMMRTWLLTAADR